MNVVNLDQKWLTLPTLNFVFKERQNISTFETIGEKNNLLVRVDNKGKPKLIAKIKRP